MELRAPANHGMMIPKSTHSAKMTYVKFRVFTQCISFAAFLSSAMFLFPPKNELREKPNTPFLELHIFHDSGARQLVPRDRAIVLDFGSAPIMVVWSDAPGFC